MVSTPDANDNVLGTSVPTDQDEQRCRRTTLADVVLPDPEEQTPSLLAEESSTAEKAALPSEVRRHKPSRPRNPAAAGDQSNHGIRAVRS